MVSNSILKVLVLCLFLLSSFLANLGCPEVKEEVKGPPTIKDSDATWHLVGKNGINLNQAWAVTEGSKDVTIAIIDRGFLYSPAFSGSPANDTPPANYALIDYFQGYHGEAVASVISTHQDNPLGIIGVNDVSPVVWIERGESWEAGLPLLIWATRTWSCDTLKDVNLHCTGWYDKLFDVINLSFIINLSGSEESIETYHWYFSQTVSHANKENTIIVAAAGNEEKNAIRQLPNYLTNVIAVGATTRDGKAAKFSNWGETVNIMAPGEDILVAKNIGTGTVSGTSFSAPIITGVISLMKSVYKELNWKTAVYLLQTTSVPMDCEAYCVGREECEKDCCQGNEQVCTPGRVDAGAAVAAAKKVAQEGLPKVALIDADYFMIPLVSTASGGVSGNFEVRNIGTAPGRYLLTSDNPNVLVSPTEIELAEKGHSDGKDTMKITLSSSKSKPGWTNIRIASPSSGKKTGFTDEIIVSAQAFGAGS